MVTSNSKNKDEKKLNEEDKLLKKLIDNCIAKNKNLKRHLKRYCSTLGIIKITDFIRGIDELKFGFIESEIITIKNLCENDGIYMKLDSFMKIVSKVNPNYDLMIKEPDFDDELKNFNTSKKHSYIDKKTFNIKY